MNLNAIVSFVYPFLSEKDQKLLSKVSKSLRECEYKRHFYERISGFIQNHFKIIQCSFDVSLLPALFFQDRVIYVLGEVHSVYLHRYLNGSLINLLFKERASILGEGDLQRVQDQICFVDAAFRERVSCWDCRFPHLDVLGSEMVLSMQVVQNFYLRFPYGFEIDFFQLSDFINQTIPSFKSQIYEMEEIQNWDLFEWGSEEKIKASRSIYSKISHLFYCHLRDLHNGYFEKLVACDEKRESRLVSKIKEVESTVFVIAGTDHARSSIVKKGVKRSPHLLLQPKDKLNWLDVFKDLNKCFPEKSFMSIDAPASKELPPVKMEGLSLEENIILLKKRFINFNFELIGSGPNHFGYWFRTLMSILAWDMKHTKTK